LIFTRYYLDGLWHRPAQDITSLYINALQLQLFVGNVCGRYGSQLHVMRIKLLSGEMRAVGWGESSGGVGRGEGSGGVGWGEGSGAWHEVTLLSESEYEEEPAFQLLPQVARAPYTNQYQNTAYLFAGLFPPICSSGNWFAV
jgi:hypothetical protein